jgi:hypothetical protein
VTFSDFASLAVASLALLLTIWQFRWTKDAARKAATLDRLGKVVVQFDAARLYELEAAETEILRYYRRETDQLETAARQHLRLLDELDLLALAIVKDLVDGGTAREYLRGSYAPNAVATIWFINELRECCNEPTLYEHLYELLPTLLRPTPRWVSSFTPDEPPPRLPPGAPGAEVSSGLHARAAGDQADESPVPQLGHSG